MSEPIAPGKYTAKVLDYGISGTKAGDPQVSVKFGFGSQSMIWNGTLKQGKGQEITLKSLIVLGLTNPDKIADLADGLKGNTLDLTKEVEIDIQPDTYEGNTTLKIKWINEPGLNFLMGKEDFKQKIASMNLKTTFAYVKQQIGQPRKKPMEGGGLAADAQLIDTIPF